MGRLTAERCDDAIDEKIADIDEQIAALQRNGRVMLRIGGSTIANFDDEVAFQQSRRDLLMWAKDATADDIRGRAIAAEQELGPEGIAAKFDIVRGLSDGALLMVVEAELMDIALGQHPARVAIETGTPIDDVREDQRAEAVATFDAVSHGATMETLKSDAEAILDRRTVTFHTDPLAPEKK